ncbi:uncharacterized protein isoform X2 [Macaca fascicularis]|uniref:uncharacterized protein isoform X2 n=1 Tax=Macaca fascicularis TaxID=9541 RepID=UPI0032B04390
MPGATPAWCEWERARAPGCVLLADIHGSCSGRVRVRVCVCVLVVLYWHRGGGRGGGARAPGGEPGRASPLPPSLPPQLDPVVKAEREAGWVRLAAYGRRREPGRRGAEARRGEAGRKGLEPVRTFLQPLCRRAARQAAVRGGRADFLRPGLLWSRTSGTWTLALLVPHLGLCEPPGVGSCHKKKVAHPLISLRQRMKSTEQWFPAFLAQSWILLFCSGFQHSWPSPGTL